jgi:hypothetical protein
VQAIISLAGQLATTALQSVEDLPVLGGCLKWVRDSIRALRQSKRWNSRVAGAQTTLAVAAPFLLSVVAAALICLAIFFMVSPSLRAIDPGFIFNSGVGFLVFGVVIAALIQVGGYICTVAILLTGCLSTPYLRAVWQGGR